MTHAPVPSRRRARIALSVLCVALLCAAACGPEDRAAADAAPGADAPTAPASADRASQADEPPLERPPRPLFRDVTEAAGLDFLHETGATGRKYLPETMGAGACVLDHDGDGLLDLYLVQSGRVPGDGDGPGGGADRLFRNRGDGTFEDVTASAGELGRGYGQGCVAADVEGDGDTDLYVVNFGPNELLRNEGDGTFRSAGAEAAVDDPLWGSSAVFFDADGDADLDLLVVNYLDFTVETHVDCGEVSAGKLAYCHPDAYPSAPDRFFRNRGDGTFEEATSEAGLVESGGKGLGAVVTDFDGDGDADVYVANDSTPNFLWVGDGAGHFEERGLLLGVSHDEEGLTQAGMGVDAGDVDGDLRMDLFVTNLSREPNSLHLGSAGAFRAASREAGLHVPSFPHVGFGTDLFEVDLDGDLDLYVANGHVIDNVELFDDALTWSQPGQLFLGDGAGHFEELAPARCGAPCERRVGRATATIDFDDDGRLDLVVTLNGGPVRLFRNEAASGGRWIGLVLTGEPPNPAAVGARVTLETNGRRQVREVRAGGSYQASNDPRVHFGLGAAASADRIVIDWPSGARDVLENVTGGHYHPVREGANPSTAP